MPVFVATLGAEIKITSINISFFPQHKIIIVQLGRQ